MNHAEIASKFFDEDLRIASITWLAAGCHGIDEDVLERVLDAVDGERNVHESMKAFAELPDWAQDEDGFCEWIGQAGRYGFLVEVETPKPVAFHPGGHTSYGFGYTTSTMIYVEAIEDVVDLAIAWKEALLEKLRRDDAA